MSDSSTPRRLAPAALAALAVSTAGLALILTGAARAGAYVFADQFPDSLTHPTGYGGSGGPLNVRVCIRPGGQNGLMRIPVQNIVDRARLQVAAQPNLRLGSANDIPGSRIDFESVALHELGHCLGLAHPNAASESGLASDEQDSTRALAGRNGVLDPNAGADRRFGSPDDARRDDENLHWFEVGVNDPFREPLLLDALSYTRDLSALPSGDRFAANADRAVGAADFGVPDTEAVMQQGTGQDEAQRFFGADDVTTLRFAQNGLDRTPDTSDDYTIDLVYGGISSSPICDVTLGFETGQGFAFCALSGVLVGDDLSLSEADATFASPSEVSWHFTAARIPFPAPDIAIVAPGQATDRVNGGESSLLANDAHPDGLALTATANETFGGPSEGTVTIETDGTFRYQHTGSGEGTDQFVYEVCAGSGQACSHQRVIVQISASANTPPEAAADALTVAEGGEGSLLDGGGASLLDNDEDPDGDGLIVTPTPATPPMNGTVVLATDGTFSYFHDGSETVSDAFAYELCDDRSPALCTIGTVTVTVAPVNDPASAEDDELAARTEDANRFRIQTSTLTRNDSPGAGEDDQELELVALENIVGGSAAISSRGLDFTLAPDFFGEARFDYLVADDGETGGEPAPSSARATARFEVRAVNDEPLAEDDLLDPIEEDAAPLVIEAATLLANDRPGPENEADQTLRLDAVSGAVGGDVALDDQRVTFTPAPDFFGEARFDYRVEDDGRSNGLSDPERAEATVRLPVLPVDDLPRARADALVLRPGDVGDRTAAGEGSLLVNDVDPEGSALTAAESSAPAEGLAVVAADGTFSYAHGGGAPGFDAFRYEACESEASARCGSATVTVAILDPTLATCAPGASRAVAEAPFLASYAALFPAGATGFEAIGLPPGLSIDDESGAVLGVAPVSAVREAPYEITVLVPGVRVISAQILVDAPGEALFFDAFENPCAATVPAAAGR